MISILFTTNDDLVSWAIRSGTGSDVSHCGVQTPAGVYEMRASGLVCTPTDEFRTKNHVVSEWPWPDLAVMQEPLIRDYCATELHEGVSYDYLGLAGEFWVQANRLFGRSVADPWHMRHALICSRFCLQVLRANGYDTPALRALDEGTVWPGQLRDALLKTSGALRYGDKA